MNHAFLLRTCIGTALVSSVLFLVFNVLRLTFVFNIAHSFLILNMLAVAGIASIGLWQWRKLSITRLEWLIVGALLISIVFADYTGRQSAYILIDIARPVLFFAVIITLRHCLGWSAFSNSQHILKLLGGIVAATTIAVVGCTAVDRFVVTIYPAYSSIDSVLGLGWLVATTGAAPPLLFLMMLVISGKRAVYLAAGFVMLLVYRKQPKQILMVVLIVAVASSASFLRAVQYAMPRNAPIATPLDRPSQKKEARADIATIPPLDVPSQKKESRVVEYFSGGRLDEIRDAIRAVPSYRYYITGMGPGFAYPSQFFAPQGFFHRNLHFTPLSLIIEYGLIFSVLFAIYIARMLPAAWRTLNDKSNPIGMSYAMYFFASLPFALTEYSIFAYANFAIACGLIAAFDKKHAS